MQAMQKKKRLIDRIMDDETVQKEILEAFPSDEEKKPYEIPNEDALGKMLSDVTLKKNPMESPLVLSL